MAFFLAPERLFAAARPRALGNAPARRLRAFTWRNYFMT